MGGTVRPGTRRVSRSLVSRGGAMPAYETLLYETDGAIATITLNRPERLNTIVPPMPSELEDAVWRASRGDAIKGIGLRGAGGGVCAGFDFRDGLRAGRDAANTHD